MSRSRLSAASDESGLALYVSSIMRCVSQARHDHQAQLPPHVLQPVHDFIPAQPVDKANSSRSQCCVHAVPAEQRQANVIHLPRMVAAETNPLKAVALDLVGPQVRLRCANRRRRPRARVIPAIAHTSGSSRLRMATPPSSAGGRAAGSSDLAWAMRSMAPEPFEMHWADVGHDADPGPSPLANCAISPSVYMPISSTARSCSRRKRSSVKGSPISLLRLPSLRRVT